MPLAQFYYKPLYHVLYAMYNSYIIISSDKYIALSFDGDVCVFYASKLWVLDVEVKFTDLVLKLFLKKDS